MQCVEKKAGFGGHREPATTINHVSPYRSCPVKSTGFLRQSFPGPRDRAQAQPPAVDHQPYLSVDGATLGLLVLRLCASDCELTQMQRSQAWALAERWLGQLVESKHGQEVAA